MNHARARRLLVAIAAVSLVVVGCATTTSSPSPSGDGGATTVAITLQEWAVVPASSSAAAGDITFEVTNEGPEDIHEFVVIQTDLDVAELPTDENGAVDEAGEGMEVIDEIEDIPVGESQQLTVTLEPGSYALVCNILAHYQMGMRTSFTVTDN